MKLKFAFLNLFLGCISLLIINTKFISNAKGEELLKVELHNEIKKGKFRIHKLELSLSIKNFNLHQCILRFRLS